jgi:succinoglycan biosynthesis transport protein ExoP
VEEIQHSFRSSLRIFFRRKWVLISCAFFGLILGVCASILLPRVYKSSTTILIQEGKTDNPLFSNIAVSSTITQRAQAIHEIILGWESLGKLIQRLKLDSNVKTKLEYQQLVDKLRKDIQITMREGNIIDLSYASNDPKKARDVVQSVTDIFIERNVNFQNKETSDAIKFIEEQLHVYRGKIKSAEIAGLKDKLNVLLVDATEEHPMVKQLRAEIDKKMQELKKENLEYSEDSKLSMETTSPMIDQIKKTLDSITTDKSPVSISPSKMPTATGPVDDKDVYKMMLIDKLDNVMARDVNVNETIYNSLLQRLETAKITQRLQSSKEGTKYTVINPPQIPVQPAQPIVPLMIVGGLFLGLFTGVGFIFMNEFLDKSFLDVQQASHYLGMPLMGAISRINTKEILTAARRKTQYFVFLMTSAGIAFVVITLNAQVLLKS